MTLKLKNDFISDFISIRFVHERMSYDILFLLPCPPFKNIIKIFIKFFYLSFRFYDMQIDCFAFLSLALTIVQLESVLNSL